MALTALLDTSVLTRLSRPTVRAAVEALLAEGQVARPTISDLEIGFSARNEDEWTRRAASLDVFQPVETTSAHVRRALQVQRLLAARSLRGRKVPDLLVAAAAEERGVPVVHYDGDFDLISDVTGQDARWVVPPGTVS